MKRKYSILYLLVSTALLFTTVSAAHAQFSGDLSRVCQTRASDAVNVSISNVDVRRGENLSNGNYILLWEARQGNNRSTKGYCEADPKRGQIVRFEKSEYQGGGPGRPGGWWPQGNAEKICRDEVVRRLRVDDRNIGTDPLRNGDNGNYRIKWYTDRSYGSNLSGVCEIDKNGRLVDFDRDNGQGGGGRPITNYPRVKADTDGRGTFDGPNVRNGQVTRGYVNTEDDKPSVRFTGRNFKITFYGYVDSKISDREFTMAITDSDRGNARGRAQVRLNPDRNEVEMISVEGRMNRDDFNGKFNRNR